MEVKPYNKNDEKITKVDPPKDYIVLDIVRQLDGLSVRLESKFVEEMFRSWSKGVTITPRLEGDETAGIELGDLKAYKIGQLSSLPPLPSGKKAWGSFSHGLLINGVFNLRFLTLVGLGNGVTIKFKLPYSKEMIKDFIRKFDETVPEFITDFAKPVKATSKYWIEDREVKVSKEEKSSPI